MCIFYNGTNCNWQLNFQCNVNFCVNVFLLQFQADGLTAIEAWLIACIVFVFAALVEYTGILLKMKMRKLTGTKRKKDNYAITDLAFFVFFPILFTIFNVLYWTSICWKRLEEQEKYNL